MTGQCGLIGGPASSVAQSGLATVQSFAKDALSRSENSASLLVDFLSGMTPISSNINLDDIGSLSSPFSNPDDPTAPDTAFDVPEIEYEPYLNDVAFVSTVSHPGEFGERPPTLDFGTRPTPIDIANPGNAPTIAERTMPTAPDEEIPPLPSLRGITIPAMDNLTLPTFEGVFPDALQVSDVPAFSWTETPYSATVRDDLVTQIQAILGGSSGIPEGIWDMILARVTRQLELVLDQAVDGIESRYSSMGHMLPAGPERRRVRDAEHLFTEALGEHVRQQAVQDAQIAVERLNTALAQGIALEGQLMNLHNQQAARSLQAAQLMITITIQAAQLKVTAYNARMQAYGVQAQVFVQVMQGELAKLEKFKAQLEGQKLIGELNLQDLEAYKTRIQAIESTYTLYTEQVKGVLGQIEADKTRVEGFEAEVRAFEAIHRSKETEWRGYGETVKAELGKLEPFKALADVHLGRLRGYEIGIGADKAKSDAQVSNEQLKIQRLGVDLNRVKTLLDAEVSRVSALNQTYATKGQIFATHGRLEDARVSSDAQRLQLMLGNADARAKVALQNLQASMAHRESLSQIQLRGFSDVLGANAQIGASSISSLNYSATISDSVSNSTGCSTTYSQ